MAWELADAMERITHRTAALRGLADLRTQLARYSALQNQMTSGKLVTKPSDSPTATASSLRLRAEMTRHDQYTRSASDGNAWLSTVDNTLSDVYSDLQSVRSLVVQGANTGSLDPAARAAIAAEVGSMRDGLVQTTNATYLGRPVLGGVTTGTAAYDASGTFVGSATYAADGTLLTGGVNRTVANGEAVRVDVTGPEAFGTGPDSMFSVLADIKTHLTSNPSALAGDLTRLDTVMSGLARTQADVGARQARVESAQQSVADHSVVLAQQLSTVEDIDLPKAVVQLQLQQTSYQAALGAMSKVIAPSLADFLR
jgi:flagellar hook-associated protein 3 FlgL